MKRGHSRRKKNNLKWKLLGSGALLCFSLAVVLSYFYYPVFATKKEASTEDVKKAEPEHGGNTKAPENTNKEDKMTAETKTSEAAETETAAEAREETQEKKRPERFLAQMTLEQKVAQLFIILPESLTGTSGVTQAGAATQQALLKYPVGGIIYMKSNIKSPAQLMEMTSKSQEYAMKASGIPLFLSVDEEGGDISRIASNSGFQVKTFDTMWSIGQSKDLSKAYEVGDTIGTYLSEYGLNFDFAPSGDVLSNPNNKVIGTRSFSSDPSVASDMAQKVIEGLSAHKIQYSIKHFPGHGATLGDTHDGFAYTDKTLEQLMECELIPFIDAIEAGADCVMVGHISAPRVIGDNTPSSLSKVMITDVLRNKLKFDGVVITDALNMGAIQNDYTSGEAAVKSLLAGTDILLMPADFKSAYEAVLTAVGNGTISEERLNESVLRILKLKDKFME